VFFYKETTYLLLTYRCLLSRSVYTTRLTILSRPTLSADNFIHCRYRLFWSDL